MDPIAMLKEDHQRVKGLFREFEAAGERAHVKKQRIAEQAMTELEVHSTLEEEIFYPAVKEKGPKAIKETVTEGVEEHHVVDTLMAELKQLDPSDERYDAKFTVLSENVEHHIEEEETELLPAAEKILGGDLDQIGEQMARRKQQLQQQVSGSAH